MKAWQDIKRMHSVYTTINSEWWLDRGCKIELFTDEDRFEVKNVMTDSDHYEDVDDEVMNEMVNEGWYPGTALLNIKVILKKVRRIEDMMSDPKCTEDSLLRLSKQKDRLLEKTYQHTDNLSNTFVHLKKLNQNAF